MGFRYPLKAAMMATLVYNTWALCHFDHMQSRFLHLKHFYASAAAAAAIVLIPTSAIAAGDVGKGEQIFNNNCASCHLGGANFVSEQRTLKKEALEKYGIGLEPESILTFVSNSQRHKNLVFFRAEGGKLNPGEWVDVTAFVSDQSKGAKW